MTPRSAQSFISLWTWSLCPMSRTVVTPLRRQFRELRTASMVSVATSRARVMSPKLRQRVMWVWALMRPGMITFPAQSTASAPANSPERALYSPIVSTAVILLPSTSRAPLGMTFSPSMVMIFALIYTFINAPCLEINYRSIDSAFGQEVRQQCGDRLYIGHQQQCNYQRDQERP